MEALALHRGVGDEAEVNPVARRDERLRKLAAAETTQNGRLVRVAVEGLQVVVRAFLVLLDLELVERLPKTQRTAKNRRRISISLDLRSRPCDVPKINRRRRARCVYSAYVDLSAVVLSAPKRRLVCV